MGVDPQLLRDVYQLPKNFDIEKVSKLGQKWIREQSLEHLQEAGIPPAIAGPLLEGNPDAATAAAKDYMQERARDFLREKGIDPKLAETLADGNWKDASKILQQTGRDELRQLASDKGIPPEVVSAVEKGKQTELRKILATKGRDSLFQEVARQSGLPKAAIRQGTDNLISGRWAGNARKLVENTYNKEFNRHIKDLGVTPKEWKAMCKGELPDSMDMKRAAEMTHGLGQKMGWTELAGRSGMDVKQLQNFSQSVPWNQQNGWDIQNKRDLDTGPISRSTGQMLSELALRKGLASYRVIKDLKEYQRSAGR